MSIEISIDQSIDQYDRALLKLKVPKLPYGTAALKPYRTVNTRPKLTFNSSVFKVGNANLLSSILSPDKKT
jgi:hypothetical protein